MSKSTTDLRAQLDREFAPAWRSTAGDTLVGEIVALDARTGWGDEPYPIVTVRRDDGSEVSWHAFGAVPRRELARLRPAVGETIAVRDDGEVATDDGRRKYRAWSIAVDRDERPFDWGVFADDETAAADPAQPSLLDTPMSDVPTTMDDDAKGGDDVPF